MSASAEVTNSADAGTRSAESVQGSESVGTQALSQTSLTPVSPSIEPGAVDATEKPTQEAQASLSNVQAESPAGADVAQAAKTSDSPEGSSIAQSTAMPLAQTTLWGKLPSKSYRVADSSPNTKPVPGTTTTSAAALKTAPAGESQPQTTAETQNSPDTKVAQFPPIDPGRPTRSGSSYLGVAGNIGLTGDQGLGNGTFAIISKIGLTRTLSVRPAALIGDNTSFLIPLTYDLSLRSAGEDVAPARFAPYLGAGVAINTGDDTDVGFLVTGGVDVPLTREFTATAGLNASVGGETNLGLLLGVGYNFNGF
jgi:hypothetical protein